MKIPSLTHLQFMVIGIISGSKRSGKYVRDKLLEQGVHKSGPAFYQLMSRLEDAGLVEGWYVSIEIDGKKVRERTYRVTGHGFTCWAGTRDFYLDQAGAQAAGQGGLNHA